MLKLQNIKKSFGEVEVLKGIDLEIKESEIVSIVGASGAGKTTLLQIAGTLLRPDSGKVIINNTEVEKLSDKNLAEFRNQNIGFVFQFHHLLPEFTALENVCIPAMIGGKKIKDVEERAKELLAFLNLEHRISHKPLQLSGGEQQRVAIARAMINNPKVIFADEPSGNLDSKNREELHNLIIKVRQKYQSTFVIVTHDEQFANQSDRIISIKDGIII